jgi:hypothetical protein
MFGQPSGRRDSIVLILLAWNPITSVEPEYVVPHLPFMQC